jgi:hypothetical protein
MRSPELEAEVVRYLERHPGLAGGVEAIREAARREFGPQAELSLSVYRDPEIEDEYLTLNIRLTAYGDDTLSRIRALSEPFEEHLWDGSGSVLVTTDFGPIG